MPKKVTRRWNEAKGQTLEVPCAMCHQITNHDVHASIDDTGHIEEGNDLYQWQDSFQLIYCRGCGAVSLRHENINSDDFAHTRDGEPIELVNEKLYPSRIEGRKDLLQDAHLFPYTVRLVYQETIQALSAESPILAGAGLRALVEAVCKAEQAAGFNLYERIDDLVEKQLLTPSGAAILHKIRTLGNQSIHESRPHSDKQLGLAMDVVEHLLSSVYILPKRIESEFRD